MGMVLSIVVLAISGCGKSQTAIAPEDLLTMVKRRQLRLTKKLSPYFLPNIELVACILYHVKGKTRS